MQSSGQMAKISALLLGFALAACAGSGVIPMDAGAYMIAQTSPQAGFGPPVTLRAEVYQEANTFCAKQGKEVETVKLEMVNSAFARPGSVTLTFRCK